MHIGQVLDAVYDDEIGWRPSSGGIKPVHVANGLVRALTEQHFDLERLHRFIVWWKAGKRPDDSRSYESLVREDDIYASIASSARDFDRARRFLGGLLNADRAVFPSVEKSDLTLTSAQMVSRSGSDRGLGDFGATLLQAAPGSRALADALLAAVKADRPADPITAAVWPLLDPNGKTARRTTRRQKPLSRAHNADFVEAFQAAAADLATHEAAQGNRLRTLERIVHFICVAPLVQAQWLGANGEEARRVPILMSLGDRAHAEVILAGEISLRLVYERFEEWLGEALATRLAKELPVAGSETLAVSTDGRTVRKILRSIADSSQNHGGPDEEIMEARMAAFQATKQSLRGADAARLLGHTLVAAYLQEYESGGPRVFLRALSARVGLIYPHFQGRGARRVRPSTAVLDMIVRACVPSGESVPLPVFLDRLRKRFGLVVGGHRSEDWDDLDALYRQGIAVDAAALDANTDLLVRQLEAMGLARRYADNVTFIGDAHGS